MQPGVHGVLHDGAGWLFREVVRYIEFEEIRTQPTGQASNPIGRHQAVLKARHNECRDRRPVYWNP